MLRTTVFAVTMTISWMIQADMTPEQLCDQEGEAAGRAAELRGSGSNKDAAIQTLLAEYPLSESGLTEQNIMGLAYVAYMAKMSPAKMRDYAKDQCMQNTLR